MKYFYLALIFLGLFACQSVKRTTKAMNSGNYMEAINMSVSQLQKGKDRKKSPEYADLLYRSYQKMKERDLELITFLRKENLQANTKEIFELYKRLDRIQQKIKPLTPLEDKNGDEIAFNFEDYSDVIIQEKENYVDYLYKNSLDFIENGNKTQNRVAFNYLEEIENLMPGYKNINELKKEAFFNGTDFVIVTLQNNTNMIIPEMMEDRLLNFDTYGLDDFWTEYHVSERTNINYDFAVDIEFINIEFSPERLVEREIPLEREVKDGWQYKKDRNGNFILDSDGEKIKEDIYVNVSGILYETFQTKYVDVQARVDYFDLITNQKINSYPLESQFVFENRFASFNGDDRVLGKDEKFLLTQRPVDYPTNEQMLTDASDDIKSKLKSILISQNRN
ncbi:hypothetical protein [Psychroflexus aestuariivivens]|uniref:hypothetical protein n=1 Tax=Psychroflexus aestuariivivens TaxID=1795040 RepID=UPI000FD759E5|nr:hypothetical protein [Psychroflexus aestuariivivens]